MKIHYIVDFFKIIKIPQTTYHKALGQESIIITMT
jgi:hypothetical protein